MNIINNLRAIERYAAIFLLSLLFFAISTVISAGAKVMLILMLLILIGGCAYPLYFLFASAHEAVKQLNEDSLEMAAVRQYECLRIYAGIAGLLAVFFFLAAMFG